MALQLLTALALLSASFEPDLKIRKQAEQLRDAALSDDTAYRYLESLTTEIGPRLAGTEDEARARSWSVKALKALGFKQVRVEPFDMETWIRGKETARILAPFPQPLSVTALGRSGSTGSRELTGTVAVFQSIKDLEALPSGSLRGKIAYVSHQMGKTMDGSSYGYFGKVRFKGPSIAASKGAKAILIRSVGTDSHRMPHTGGTSWEEKQIPIPALALSNPDADQLERIARRGQSIKVGMTVTPKVLGMRKSGNVIVDLPGTDSPKEIVVVGGHLDSWDLGTGAVDDGAGVAITTGAVHLIQKLGLKPKRTIRLIHWGAEEVGLYGAKAYAKAHADELGEHVLGSESDFGAERVYAIHANVSSDGEALIEAMLAVMAPLGIGRGTMGPSFTGSGGPDLIPLHSRGLPRFRLAQDGTDYFDLHHTPDDTFDKVKPEALAQNVAAYAVFLWFVANSDVDFRPSPAVSASE
ncbi:MAG: M20/M25/M40 family metallo-hydrolase [Myxococcota bacterium]